MREFEPHSQQLRTFYGVLFLLFWPFLLFALDIEATG